LLKYVLFANNIVFGTDNRPQRAPKASVPPPKAKAPPAVKESAAEQEERERLEYERLKKKFGDAAN
jgi:hypothetical protein